MKIQIHDKFGALLYEGEHNSIKAALLTAIEKKVNLRSANLSSADLSYADLSSADLRSANLSYADLRSAKNAELVIAQTRILSQGDLIGWKKARTEEGKEVIVELLIPKRAKRSHAFGRKCRASYAKVLKIYGAKKAHADYDSTFIYQPGKIVRPRKPFCENWMEECASGIHFFITKIEAESFNL